MKLTLSIAIILVASLAFVTCNPPLNEAGSTEVIAPVGNHEELEKGSTHLYFSTDLPDWITTASKDRDLEYPKELSGKNIDWRKENNTDDFEDTENEPFEISFPVDRSGVDKEDGQGQVLAELAEEQSHPASGFVHAPRRTKRSSSRRREKYQANRLKIQNRQQRYQNRVQKQQKRERSQQRQQRYQRRLQKQQRYQRRYQDQQRRQRDQYKRQRNLRRRG